MAATLRSKMIRAQRAAKAPQPGEVWRAINGPRRYIVVIRVDGGWVYNRTVHRDVTLHGHWRLPQRSRAGCAQLKGFNGSGKLYYKFEEVAKNGHQFR